MKYMIIYLVCDWFYCRYGQHVVNLFAVEVRNADGLDKFLLHKLLHLFPSIQVIAITTNSLVVFIQWEDVISFLQSIESRYLDF